VLEDLIKIAGELDALGLNREADIVDALIRKVAGPLADIAEWETGNEDLKLTDEERIMNKEHRRGVGWGLPPEGVDVTKWVMEKSPGDWVFVIPDNVYNIERYVMSASFERWLKKKLYGKGHYIFVVGASPYRGDFSDPKWVVHDLVGHSVGNKFTKALVRTGVRYNDWINRQDVGFAIDKIWGLLPPELQNAEEVFDRVFDISAAIILFEDVTLEWALGVISSVETDDMENLTKGITLMFDSAQRWLKEKKWVDIGGNKVSIIKPWE
jgi:hypothetical protein